MPGVFSGSSMPAAKCSSKRKASMPRHASPSEPDPAEDDPSTHHKLRLLSLPPPAFPPAPCRRIRVICTDPDATESSSSDDDSDSDAGRSREGGERRRRGAAQRSRGGLFCVKRVVREIMVPAESLHAWPAGDPSLGGVMPQDGLRKGECGGGRSGSKGAAHRRRLVPPRVLRTPSSSSSNEVSPGNGGLSEGPKLERIWSPPQLWDSSCSSSPFLLSETCSGGADDDDLLPFCAPVDSMEECLLGVSSPTSVLSKAEDYRIGVASPSSVLESAALDCGSPCVNMPSDKHSRYSHLDDSSFHAAVSSMRDECCTHITTCTAAGGEEALFVKEDTTLVGLHSVPFEEDAQQFLNFDLDSEALSWINIPEVCGS